MKKISGGRVSPQQVDWHNYLQSINQSVIICKGFEDAKSQIEEFKTTTIMENYGGTEPD
jgi:hypothetical protein